MPDIFTPELPVFADITAAVERLKGRTIRTPLLESPLLNQRMGRRILVKPECLQRTGSFKFRGASNKILALGDSVKAGGVVAYSSGNHAQGVAAAAHFAGIPALIVMPSDAPAIKRANTAAWGAEIKLYDRFTENREALAQSIAKSRGAAIVPPYDDPLVIAGQGTVGVAGQAWQGQSRAEQSRAEPTRPDPTQPVKCKTGGSAKARIRSPGAFRQEDRSGCRDCGPGARRELWGPGSGGGVDLSSPWRGLNCQLRADGQCAGASV